MNRIDEKFNQLKKENRKALIGYFTAGFPDFETSIEVILKSVKAGVDIVEIGVPFSDPIADGPIIQHTSNAMNVGHPSNLARLVDFYGGWIMDERDEKGNVVKYGVLKRRPDMEKLRDDFISFSITDEEVNETIKNFYEKYKVIIEPHTAVGIKSYEKSKIDDCTVVLQTADPAKFPEKIKQILNIEPEITDTLKEIIEKEENFDVIESDYETFKNYMLSRIK